MNTQDLKLLQYIYNYQREHLNTPTYWEMKKILNVDSDNSVVKRLKRMHELGLIDMCKGKIRMIRILDKGVAILTSL